MRFSIWMMIIAVAMLFTSGCIQQSEKPPVNPTQTPEQELDSWNMKLVWSTSVSTGIPFLDLSPDGNLAAAIDFDGAKLYLVKPTGESVLFKLKKMDEAVEPAVAGVALKDGKAYVLASYQEFAGVRIFSWEGQVGEERHGWSGSVADSIARSPDGSHLCYLITTGATTQELYCDGVKTVLEDAGEYSMLAISDSGLVAIGGQDGNVLVFKDGNRVFTMKPDNEMVLVYDDKIIGQFNDTLKVVDSDGDVLAQSRDYELRWTTLLRPTLLASEKYLFWYEPLGNTHVLNWKLTEVRQLPGFPFFANDGFVLTGGQQGDGGSILHCYSLTDFHEVFSVTVPTESIGYVKLNDDGKVLIVSGENKGFWLYSSAQR